MHYPSLLALAFAASATTSALADNDPVPNPPVPVNVKDVFVPVGFDSNDEVELILDGYLPDTCYKLAFPQVTFDRARQAYRVRQYARKIPGICFETPVPFTTEVRIGLVKAGAYGVVSLGAESQSLEVAVAIQNSPDDYLYAPVDAVRVEQLANGEIKATIEGRLTSSCMQVAELRLIDTGRTLQLLPILRIADEGACVVEERQFVESVRLPAGMTPGRHLLHVRSLNGKARNAVFTVH